jgi:hypothetical protein
MRSCSADYLELDPDSWAAQLVRGFSCSGPQVLQQIAVSASGQAVTGPGTQDLGVVTGQNRVPGVAERLETLGGAALRGLVVAEDWNPMVIQPAREVGDVGAEDDVA